MRIKDYEFGRIIIDNKLFKNDVIINGEKVIPEWMRKRGHLADIEDMKKISLEDGTHLIIGTGYYGVMKIDSSLEEYCKKHNIILDFTNTQSAIEIFNKCESSEKVIGAFHLTC